DCSDHAAPTWAASWPCPPTVNPVLLLKTSFQARSSKARAYTMSSYILRTSWSLRPSCKWRLFAFAIPAILPFSLAPASSHKVRSWLLQLLPILRAVQIPADRRGGHIHLLEMPRLFNTPQQPSHAL